MATFTLCPNLVNYLCSNLEDFVNVLLTFCQDNGRKVAFDIDNKLISSYENVVENKANLAFWLKFLTNLKNNTEYIDSSVNEDDDNQQVVITICSNTYDKILSSHSKADYLAHQEMIENISIRLLDKDELRNEFKNSQVIITNTTSGDHSPIITGSGNQMN